jgi:ABC-type transporter Mla subunit MlaD
VSGWTDDRLTQRVGAIAIAGGLAVVAALVVLADRVEVRAPIRIRVGFRHVAGLRERAPLVAGGQPIGRIEALVPVPRGAAGALGGEVGVVAIVAVDRDSAWKLPAGSTIFVASRGALADRYLEVAPPRGDPGPAIRDGAELRGADPPTLDRVLHHTWANMTSFKLFVETLRPELTALRAQVDRLRVQVGELARDPRAAGGVTQVAAEAAGLYAAGRATYDRGLGGAPGVARLRAMLAEARRTLGELRAAIDVLGPRLAGLTGQLDRVTGELAARDPVGRARASIAAIRSVIDRVEPVVAGVAALADQLAAGEGSIGRILGDPEFPEDTKDLGKIIKRQPWKILEHYRE